MSKIEELIAEYCPDGVEFKLLGEVCSFRNGFAFKSGRFKSKGEPILRIGNIQNRKIDVTNVVYFHDSDYSENLKPFKIENGDILIAMSGATTGKVGRLESEGTYYMNQRVGKFEPNSEFLLNDFLFHYLLTKNQALYALAGGGAQPNLSSGMLMKQIQIPLPPLPVQEEVVRILDSFTALEAELETELEAELEARRTQYDYYRNQLLSFEGQKVEWKALGEVCTSISAGGDLPKRINREQVFPSEEFPYPIYANAVEKNGLYGFSDNYRIESDSVTIAARGAKIGFHTIREGKYTPIVRLISLIPNKKIITTRYLNYALYITEISGTKGGIPQLTVPTVKKLMIPVPPFAEQERIVSILDQFDALVNDISLGLPAEIKARRQQYEYYREKLLTFEPLKA